MDKYKLNGNLQFTAETYKGKFRFVVYEHKTEFVYKIETRKNIEQFLKEKETRIFKGRLQLHKIGQQINIEVKGEVIGSINVDHFKQMFQNAIV